MKKRIISMMLTICMAVSIMTGCGKTGDSKGGTLSETDNDTITAMLPPVSATYQEKLDGWISEFEKENPNLKVEVTTASWEDAVQKLDVQVNAGSPPDVAFINSSEISKYLNLGMVVDISQYLEGERLTDYDENVLNYFKKEEGLYGLPAYCVVWCIGGNREMLEAAGIDWRKIQSEGWTYDEFREAIKKGVVKSGNNVSTYGFVFACSGVTAKDYFSIFVSNAGMPSAFDKDLKYCYTSKKMLTFLKELRNLVDDGSMPSNVGSIDAGKRWNMMLTGQTMITGKGLPVFEKLATENNARLQNGDSSAVQDSVPVDYIVLPVPSFNGEEQAAYSTIDGYICLTGSKNPDEQHLRNVAKFMNFLSDGERAAQICQELYLTPVCQSGREAYDKLEPIAGKNEDNTATVKRLTQKIAEARPDIPAELGAKAIKIQDEVIVPKLQGLLAGDLSPEEMYQAIVEAGQQQFGESGCVTD